MLRHPLKLPLLAITAAMTAPNWPVIAEDRIPPLKILASFKGACRFQLIEGFFPCNPGVIYMNLANGRSVFTFARGKEDVFSLSGGKDRQPNLENYYLSIDTFHIHSGKTEASDTGMEGECHMRMNAEGTKFYDIKCDVYNRAKGTLFKFYLENIRSFDRKTF